MKSKEAMEQLGLFGLDNMEVTLKPDQDYGAIPEGSEERGVFEKVLKAEMQQLLGLGSTCTYRSGRRCGDARWQCHHQFGVTQGYGDERQF